MKNAFKTICMAILALIVTSFLFMKFINPYLPWSPDASLNPDPNHTHADLAIWVHGTLIDLSHDRYMSGASTNTDEAAYLHKYLHFHDGIGHVIHRHKEGFDVDDFLVSLGFTTNDNCITFDDGQQYCDQWRMMINDKEVNFDTHYFFNDLDKIMLSFGATDNDFMLQWKRMTDDACLYSKACPWRGEPPAENCIADPEVPCVADLEDDFS